MKESVWLKEYEKEVKGKRADSNSKKKIILVIVPLMMLLFVGAALMNGGSNAAQAQNAVMPMVAVFAGIMIFVVIMLCIGKKKDVTKNTRDNVKELLRSDEEVDEFDRQMSAAPVKEIKINSTSTMFLTPDYVGEKSIAMGDLTYRFARRSDMVSYKYVKTKSTTANPLKAAYFFEIRNAQNKLLLGGLADTGELLAEVEELLKIAQPAIEKK